MPQHLLRSPACRSPRPAAAAAVSNWSAGLCAGGEAEAGGGAAQVFGLLDMQEQVEAALASMAATLESSSASNILADFTQLAAMIRQEVRSAHASHLPLHGGLSCSVNAIH